MIGIGTLRQHRLERADDIPLLALQIDRGDDEGEQSPLIIEDALGKATEYELRDGVKIDAKTRTAEDEKKFDMRLLAAGKKEA